jgi:glycosyltransferase involved in cell wall biosynthesis
MFFDKENRMVLQTEKKKVYALLDKLKPDVIHVHTEFFLGRMAISYAKKRDIPLVMTAHTNWEELVNEYLYFIPKKIGQRYCRHMLQKVFNKADALIAPTHLMQNVLNRYFIRTAIQVIPTGIDPKVFGLIDDQTLLSKQSIALTKKIKDHQVLLYVGRLGKEKNIKFLIDAFYRILPNNPDSKLILVGDGPARAELEEYAKRLKITENVIFTGFIERESLAEYYAMARVFIFASKVESQGLVILESMTCGIPVVAIGEMGTKELMGGDNGGFMVQDNLDEFVEKVEMLLTDHHLHESKSAEALVEAKKWQIDMMSLKVLELYESLLA